MSSDRFEWTRCAAELSGPRFATFQTDLTKYNALRFQPGLPEETAPNPSDDEHGVVGRERLEPCRRVPHGHGHGRVATVAGAGPDGERGDTAIGVRSQTRASGSRTAQYRRSRSTRVSPGSRTRSRSEFCCVSSRSSAARPTSRGPDVPSRPA